MKVVTIIGDFVNSLPTSADKPGRFTGFTRDGIMSRVFELAATYHADIRVSGQHWDAVASRPAVAKLASSKLGAADIAHRNRVFESKLGKNAR